MADIPTISALGGDLLLAQRVELLVSSASGGSTANDKFTAMRITDLDISHPEIRADYGTRREYGHGAPQITISFLLGVTHDIIPYVRSRGLRSETTGNIPSYKYGIRATSVDGVTRTVTFNGKMIGHRYIKNDRGQGAPYDVECVVRITDESEPASTTS